MAFLVLDFFVFGIVLDRHRRRQRSGPDYFFLFAAASSSGEETSQDEDETARVRVIFLRASQLCHAWASPHPWICSSQTWVWLSPRSERKARYLPSGLQRGWEERGGSPPEAGPNQPRVSFL